MTRRLSVGFPVVLVILGLVFISACTPSGYREDRFDEKISISRCEFRADPGMESALEKGIDFTQENISATIFKVLRNLDFDHIIPKGAFVYFTHNNGKTNNLYRIDLATNTISRLAVNTRRGNEQIVQSVYNPSIYGRHVVFNDLSESPGLSMTEQKSRIIVCDLENRRKLAMESRDPQMPMFDPSIWKSRIVWKEGPEYSYTLQLYDIEKKEKREISLKGKRISDPEIYGDYIVYEAVVEGRHSVSYYDLSIGDEFGLPRTSSDQAAPSIYNKSIVFADNREGNWDIFLYDLEKEHLTQITEDPADQENPDIYQDIIVWEDHRNTDSDIFLYYLENETEIQVSDSDENERSPRVFNSLVAWKGGEKRIDRNDLYVYPIPKLSYYRELKNTTNASVI